jgi:hypothetical protein
MARPRRSNPITVDDVRTLQVVRFQKILERHWPRVGDSFDRHGRCVRTQQRIAELEAGVDVHLQCWELAPELKAAVEARWGLQLVTYPRCYRITGDELLPDNEWATSG